MQRFLNVFIFTDAVRVSGGSSAQHQQHITHIQLQVLSTNTAPICYHGGDGTSSISSMVAASSSIG